ncbi:MAG TPA: thiamine-phosphate kinase [Deltaproteobacteria bacterium]|nr:thiamine-phosphate kinase [Deltaproteobacteria bacterium]HCP46264.1 thiamine-phosphate kinase [Deltaproteobacteria bacterium]
MDPGAQAPPLSRRTEFEAIDRWLDLLRTGSEDILVPAGDDAAWLSVNAPIAMSVDRMEEGVHFRREWCAPEDLGWKALASALSDLASTRARPVGFLTTLSLSPSDFDNPDWIDGVVRGMAAAAEAFDAGPVLGGDTVRSISGLGVGVTVVGVGEDGIAPLLRSGARAGDLVQLSGDCGWAALCLTKLMEGGAEAAAQLSQEAQLAWRRPRPRLDLRRTLANATAGIDVSDGLLADAEHLSRASDVRLVLNRDACVSSGLRRAAGPDLAETLALGGGEDYQLLITAPQVLDGFVTIGHVESGTGLAWGNSEPIDLQLWQGWDHGSTV